MSISIIFTPWKPFSAKKRPPVVRRWLTETGEQGVKVFQAGMRGPHGGRKYRNLPNRSSASGEYPATQSGRLLASIRAKTQLNAATLAPLSGEVTIGSGMFYSRFLRQGTGKMARRKMSDNALQEGAPKAEREVIGWVKWTRGR